MWWISNKTPASEHANVIKSLIDALDEIDARQTPDSLIAFNKEKAEILIGIDQDWEKRATVDKDTLEWLRATRARLHKLYRIAAPICYRYGKRGGEKQAAEVALGIYLNGLMAMSKALLPGESSIDLSYDAQYQSICDQLWLEGWAVRINGYKNHVVTKEF